MKTLEDIAAEIRSQREKIDQHIRELAQAGSAEEILRKLQSLRTRAETMPLGTGDEEPDHS